MSEQIKLSRSKPGLAPEKIKQTFNNFKTTNNTIQATDLPKILQELNFDYQSLPYKVTNHLQQKQTFDFQQFQQVVDLFRNQFQPQFLRGWLEIQKFKSKLKQFLSKRNLIVSDRGTSAKIRMQIGPDMEKYNNSIKVWINKKPININKYNQSPKMTEEPPQKQEVDKSSAPTIIIEFSTKNQASKQKMSGLFQQIYENIKKMFDPQSPIFQIFDLFDFAVRHSQKGVQIVLTFLSKNLQKMFVVASKAIEEVLNTKVTAEIAAALYFDQNLTKLFGAEKEATIFNILFQNFKVEMSATFSSILTAIKQIIIQSKILNELQYEFTPINMLILLLANTELAELAIEFNNIELKPEEAEQLKDMDNMMFSKAQSMKQVGANALMQLQELFHFQKIAENIGDQIHITASGWDLSVGLDITIMDLNDLLKMLFVWAKKHDEENEDPDI